MVISIRSRRTSFGTNSCSSYWKFLGVDAMRAVPDFNGRLLIAIQEHSMPHFYCSPVCRKSNRMGKSDFSGIVQKVKSIQVHLPLLLLMKPLRGMRVFHPAFE